MSGYTNMRLSTDKPPIYDRARELFGLKDGDNTFFTYADTIYNPSNAPMPQDLIVHEETHGHQQNMDETVAKLWWERYLRDPRFRIEQECEAYAMQYRYIAKLTPNREKRARYLYELGGMLAGPMYGNVVTHTQAVQMIRSHAKI